MADKPEVSVPQDLLLKFYGGLEVLKNQQSEINRRIGRIEKAFDDYQLAYTVAEANKRRIDDLEEAAEKGGEWKGYVLHAIWWVVGVTIAASIGGLFGLEVQF